MAGISSKAAYTLENKKQKFQGQEFADDLGINYYEFKYRNHDPQIGRFIQIDPLANKYVYNSTYAFSENHVTAHVELEGLEKFSINGENLSGNTNSSAARGARNQAMLAADRKAASLPETSVKQTGGSNYRSGSFNMTDRKTGATVSQSVSAPLINDPRVSVSSKYGSDGLQAVQIVIGSPTSGVQQMFLNGKTQTAFVDGGKNSPAGESVASKPYYNTSGDLSDAYYANATWQNNAGTGAITNFDVPSAAQSLPQLNFETYFVLTNYAGSGQDKIVARVDWGYTSDAAGNVTPAGTPKVVPTNQFSKTAATIIKHDYPGYQTVQ